MIYSFNEINFVNYALLCAKFSIASDDAESIFLSEYCDEWAKKQNVGFNSWMIVWHIYEVRISSTNKDHVII
jgi:hypothetical protein